MRNNLTLLLLLVFLIESSCEKKEKWAGQESIKRVSTVSVPIQFQLKDTFDLGMGIKMDNTFDGARMNGALRINDTLISILITPENEPINNSAWYAFRIWSEKERTITIRLRYSELGDHRYDPKLSKDGISWIQLDSMNYKVITKKVDTIEVPKQAEFKIEIGPEALWVAAQEILSSKENDEWISEKAEKDYVESFEIGKSTLGKSIHGMKISEGTSNKMVVIFSRQHPPELTGYLAMKAFVNTLCEESELASNFRQEYTTYVFPFLNPDGVDGGHWRHSQAGIDLNRDWEKFNQPETRAVRDFLKKTKDENNGTFFFAADFHSTYEDVFYVNPPRNDSPMPGLIRNWIKEIGKEFPGYDPNIIPSPDTVGVASSTYMFYHYGAEALTYEVGDGTPRNFVNRKGEVAARKLMELMRSE